MKYYKFETILFPEDSGGLSNGYFYPYGLECKVAENCYEIGYRINDMSYFNNEVAVDAVINMYVENNSHRLDDILDLNAEDRIKDFYGFLEESHNKGLICVDTRKLFDNVEPHNGLVYAIEQYKVKSNNINNFDYAVSRYSATGEGSTICILISRALEIEGTAKEEVIRKEFSDVFSPWQARGMEILPQEKFLERYGKLIPKYVENAILDPTFKSSSFYYFSEVHMNFS